MAGSGERCEVVVVGLGQSGLETACRLQAAGKSVLAVDARDRVGGRTCSKVHTLDDGRQADIDLGGQWFGPHHRRVCAEVDKYGIPKRQSLPGVGEDRYFYEPEGGLLQRDGFTSQPHSNIQKAFARLNTLADDVRLKDPWNSPYADELDRQTFYTWVERELPPSQRDFMLAAVSGAFTATDGSESLLHALFYIKSNGGIEKLMDDAQAYRLEGGLQALAKARAAQLGDKVLRLGAEVTAVKQDDEGVELTTSIGNVAAQYAVIAIPPTLAGRLNYSPHMPAMRDRLTQSMAQGSALKFQTVYEEPFWRKYNHTGYSVSDRVIAETFDNSYMDFDENGMLPILVSFAYGRNADYLRSLSPEERDQIVKKHHKFMFEGDPRPIGQSISYDWSEDPYTRGCFSGHMKPGGWTSYGAALRQPVGRIHWAGTETACEGNGYVEGALEAGERAAREILERMAAIAA